MLSHLAIENNCTPGGVRYILEKNGVSVKELDRGRYLRCSARTPLTNSQHEMIDGLLLSDAALRSKKKQRVDRIKHRKRRRCSVTNTPIFYLTTIQREFADYVKSAIKIPSTLHTRLAKKQMIKGQMCDLKETYRVSWKTDLTLADLRDKWYPHGIKIVPTDLVLTPTVVKYWFYGDGSSTYKKYKGVNAYVALSLATNSFTYQECKFLADGLEKSCGCRFSVQEVKKKKYKKKQFILYCCKIDSVNAFFDYIGECDVPCFSYKWKRPLGSCTKLAWSIHKSLKKVTL